MRVPLNQLTLRHVDPSRMLFEARHRIESDVPDWYEKSSTGGISFNAWLNGAVLATMETKAERKQYYVVVAVTGLYMSDEQGSAEMLSEIDESTLREATEEERHEFANRVVDDLYPFLRSELYMLSGRLQGIRGVMLQPSPLLDERLEERISKGDVIGTD